MRARLLLLTGLMGIPSAGQAAPTQDAVEQVCTLSNLPNGRVAFSPAGEVWLMDDGNVIAAAGTGGPLDPVKTAVSCAGTVVSIGTQYGGEQAFTTMKLDFAEHVAVYVRARSAVPQPAPTQAPSAPSGSPVVFAGSAPASQTATAQTGASNVIRVSQSGVSTSVPPRSPGGGAASPSPRTAQNTGSTSVVAVRNYDPRLQSNERQAPGSAQEAASLARVLIDKGEFEEGLDMLQDTPGAAALFPLDEARQRALNGVLSKATETFARKGPMEALEMLEIGVSRVGGDAALATLSPEDRDQILRRRAEWTLTAGRLARGETLLRSYLDRRPGDSEARRVLADCLWRQDRKKDARMEYIRYATQVDSGQWPEHVGERCKACKP